MSVCVGGGKGSERVRMWWGTGLEGEEPCSANPSTYMVTSPIVLLHNGLGRHFSISPAAAQCISAIPTRASLASRAAPATHVQAAFNAQPDRKLAFHTLRSARVATSRCGAPPGYLVTQEVCVVSRPACFSSVSRFGDMGIAPAHI